MLHPDLWWRCRAEFVDFVTAPQEPLFQKYMIEAPPLSRGLVSCTGAQFCGIALIETKNRALAIVEKLEAQLDIPPGIRMHWTGCPNSCGQVRLIQGPGF